MLQSIDNSQLKYFPRNLTRATAVCVLLVLMVVAACSERGPEPAPLPETGGDIAFVNVTVIPMDRERTVGGQTVVIEADRITTIAASESIKLAPGVKVIDGAGKFLMPGLSDMHVHIWSDKEPPLYVANGVTTVRNMWGSPETLALRDAINRGDVLGPTMITAGTLIDGSPRIWQGSEEVSDPEQGRELVRQQHSAGYDFIKVYSNLTPEVFMAIADEANKLDIPFAGHVPISMDAADAMRAGMATVEHLTGLKAASTNTGYSVGNGFRSQEMMEIADRVNADEITMADVFSTEKMQELGEVAKASGTWHSATLVVIDRIFLTTKQSESYFARPEMRYISPAIRSFWNPENDFRRKDVPEEQMLAMQQFLDIDLQQVAALHAAGAGILAGTDAPNPFVLHGFAIYEELAFLEKAGLSRYEAIAAATRNPAIFLQSEGEFGTIRPGARADLILLDANPLDDLANFDSRQGVMLRGRWLGQAELLAALESVAASYENPQWFAGRDPLQFDDHSAVGESAVSSAEFILKVGDLNMGGERLAVLREGNGRQTVVAQNINTMGLLETSGDYSVEADEHGILLNYEYASVNNLNQSSGSVSRHDDGYHFVTVNAQSGAPSGQDNIVALDKRVLSNTLADWYLLAPEFAALKVGETMALDVVAPALGAPGTPLPQAWTVSRQDNAAGVTRSGMIEMLVCNVTMDLGSASMSAVVKMDSENGSLVSLDVVSPMGSMSYTRAQ